MQLTSENEFGNIISTFEFNTIEYRADFIDKFLVPVIRVLEKYELLIPFYFESSGIKSPISQLSNLPEFSRGLVHGIGYIIGEGYYLDPIYLKWGSNNTVTYIMIKCTVTNFLKYSIETKEQKHYSENSDRMKSAIEEMLDHIFVSEDWCFDIESTAYSTPTPDKKFIQNVRLEDGSLENMSELARPIKFSKPLSKETAQKDMIDLARA